MTIGTDWPRFPKMDANPFRDVAVPLATPNQNRGLLCDLLRDVFASEPVPTLPMSALAPAVGSRFTAANWPPHPFFDSEDSHILTERVTEYLPVLHREGRPMFACRHVTLSDGWQDSRQESDEPLAPVPQDMAMDVQLPLHLVTPPQHLKLSAGTDNRYAAASYFSNPMQTGFANPMAILHRQQQPIISPAEEMVVNSTASYGDSTTPADSIRIGAQRAGIVKTDRPVLTPQQIQAVLDSDDVASSHYRQVNNPGIESTLHLLLYYGHTNQVYSAFRANRDIYSRPAGKIMGPRLDPRIKSDDSNDAFFSLHLPAPGSSSPHLPAMAGIEQSTSLAGKSLRNAAMQAPGGSSNGEAGNLSSPASPQSPVSSAVAPPVTPSPR